VGWTHDLGYRPAYAHAGYTTIVLPDGAEADHVAPTVERDAVRWRAACECGWRGRQLYRRDEWPDRPVWAPVEVEGDETGVGTFAEWKAHLHAALPELEIRNLIETIENADTYLRSAVRTARRAGVTWSTIANAAGLTPMEAMRRWGEPGRTASGQRSQGRASRPTHETWR
jgi:hypothetical protein